MGQSYQSYQNMAETRAREGQEAFRQFREKAEDAASTAAAEGARALRNAGETAEDALAATKRFVQAQPLLAIGAVATVACAIGVLWKLSVARRSESLLDRMSDYVEPGYRALRRRF